MITYTLNNNVNWLLNNGEAIYVRYEDIKMITNMGKNVKIARIKAGLSQTKLAELVGLSVDTIKRIEQGTLVGSLETFCKLCKILHVSPNDLLKDDIEIADIKAPSELLDKFISLNSEQLASIAEILDKMNNLLNERGK